MGSNPHLWLCFFFALSFALPVHAKGGKRTKRIRPIEEATGFAIGTEVNIYQGTTYMNAQAEYTAPSGWAFGAVLLNAPIYGGGAQNYELDGYFVVSKFTKLGQSWNLLMGAQNGTTLHRPHQLHSFEYAGLEFRPTDVLSWHAGPYFVNDALATVHEPIGAWLGFEWRTIPGMLHVQADWWSGHNNLSGSVVNVLLFPSWPVYGYLGLNVPAAQSGNEFAGIVGLAIR